MMLKQTLTPCADLQENLNFGQILPPTVAFALPRMRNSRPVIGGLFRGQLPLQFGYPALQRIDRFRALGALGLQPSAYPVQPGREAIAAGRRDAEDGQL